MNYSRIFNSSPAAAIARQSAQKKRIASILPALPRKRRKAIKAADVRGAVVGALEAVARALRFKAKQTPGWAAAYHSACAELEKEKLKWNG